MGARRRGTHARVLNRPPRALLRSMNWSWAKIPRPMQRTFADDLKWAVRFVLSSNGTSAFDFGPALGVGAATPGSPIVYDLAISMDNDSTGTQRFSFAIGTIEGDATTWDFGFQVYRNSASDNFLYHRQTR